MGYGLAWLSLLEGAWPFADGQVHIKMHGRYPS
jgi:hypothetical protein